MNNSIKLKRRLTQTPVSYTHLDVYKRQRTKRSFVGVCTREDV